LMAEAHHRSPNNIFFESTHAIKAIKRKVYVEVRKKKKKKEGRKQMR
jgi:hypothetical protein